MDRPIAPYVTPWTGERVSSTPLTITASGIAYADPDQDALARDVDGVLWALCTGTADGRPMYGAELHPQRQREAMEALLCAGCKQPAARDKRGMLWILPLADSTPRQSWERVTTAIPPMCETCAKVSVQLCPTLRDGHVELRAREAEQIGVLGTLYPRPGEPGIPNPDTTVHYDSPESRFVLARQVVRELCEVTVTAFAAAAT